MAHTDGVDRIIEQWRTERPDLDTGPMAIFGRIFRLARDGGDATERALRRGRTASAAEKRAR